ncbi:hypothetical protein EVAR_35830_1 [Eumeta japonica]|uniref:Uncharacterized protein n=1 Tax=Eumeta variegata TaxID=151549 RepID=A0A4C1WZY1_EUMVA|nr:hypothetical protein EVAR_35830_1 [Eumeta japonica]
MFIQARRHFEFCVGPHVSFCGRHRCLSFAPKRLPESGGLPRSVRIDGVRAPEPETEVPLKPSLGLDHLIYKTKAAEVWLQHSTSGEKKRSSRRQTVKSKRMYFAHAWTSKNGKPTGAGQYSYRAKQFAGVKQTINTTQQCHKTIAARAAWTPGTRRRKGAGCIQY